MNRWGKPNRSPGNSQRLLVLNRYIKEKKLSQTYICNEIGKSVGAVNNFLTGKYSGSTFDEYINNIIRRIFPEFINGVIDFDDFVLREMQGGIPGDRHCMVIGDTRTLWYPAFTTCLEGEEGISSDYHLIFDNSKIEIDPELTELSTKTRNEIESGQIPGVSNGILLHLKEATWFPLEGEDERSVLRATLVQHEYALFYTLNTSPRGKDYRIKRLREWQRGQVIPELSPGVGVNVAIFSKDHCFMFGRRSATQGPRVGQIDFGAVEGLNVKKDLGGNPLNGDRFDVEKISKRALIEEYGISPINVLEIRYLGFGYDIEYCQWNILALAIVDIDSESIKRRNKWAPHGVLEYLETEAVRADPIEVLSYISMEKGKVWSCGIVLAYLSLINICGADVTDKASEGFDLRRQDQIL